MSTRHRLTLKPLIAALRAAGLPVSRWATLALMPGLAVAGPLGEQVVKGTVNVTRDAKTTNINQGSSKAIVNWNSFSVDGDEYVHFKQPGSTSTILNRVIGGQESQILGHIDANGRVFLVNQNGVYFGGGAKVETAGFAASTLDIKNDDFLAGKYVFARKDGAGDATVSNSGELDANQFVMLIGDKVSNDGLIQAQLGSVVLASGSKVSLQLNNSGLVNFAVDKKTLAQQAGVENAGQILAEGGRVLLSAKVAEDLVTTAVNNSGLVRATSIGEEEGRIVLNGNGGDVVNTGTLDVSGQKAGRVVVASTRDVHIDGGQVLAEGEGSSKGGMVRLIADRSLSVSDGSLVSTRGGANGGKGGFIEVSAHHGGMSLADGSVQTGKGGKLLIDPDRLRITETSNAPYGSYGASYVEVGANYIEGLLNYGTDVLLVAAVSVDAGTGMNNITATSGNAELAIKTGVVNYGSSNVSAGLFNAFDPFTRNSGGNINLAGVDINVRGNFTAWAGSATGNVRLGNVVATKNINIQGGFTAATDSSGGVVSVGNLTSGGNLVDANILVRGSKVTTGALNATGGTNVDNTRLAAVISVTASDRLTVGSALADGQHANISLTNTGDGKLQVNGNLRALAEANGEASIYVSNNPNYGGGSVEISGETRAAGSFTKVDVRAHGNLLTGNLIALSNANSSASVYVRGDANVTVGNVVATGSFADIDLAAIGAGNLLTGNLTATALAGTANVTLYNSMFNTRTGNVSAIVTGGSVDGSADANVHLSGAGNGIYGNLVATTPDAKAKIYVQQNGTLTLSNATATGTSASASIYATGNLNVAGAVKSRALNNDASLRLLSYNGNTRVGGALSAIGTSRGDVSVEGVKVVLGGGAVAKGSGSAAGTGLFEVKASSGITITGAIDVRGGAGSDGGTEGVRGFANVNLQNGTPFGTGFTGDVVVNGAITARAGFQANLDVNNHAPTGKTTLSGGINVLQTGTQSNSSNVAGLKGAIANVQGPGGITVNGDVMIRGQQIAALTLSADRDIVVPRAALNGSSSAGVNLTGPVNVNGRVDVKTTSPVPLIPASVSIGGTDIRISAPLSASLVTLQVRNGAIATTGDGIVKADELLVGVSEKSTGVAITTDASRIAIADGLVGDFAAGSYGSSAQAAPAAVAPAAPVDVLIDNTAHVGGTTVFTDPTAYFGGSPIPGVTTLALDHAIFFARNTIQFHDAVRANAMAVDVSAGSAQFLSTVDIGDGILPNSYGDSKLLAGLKAALIAAGKDLNLPMFGGELTKGPNASFAARDGITFSSGVSFNDPDVPYVVFKTDGRLDLGAGVASVNPDKLDFLAQFKAYTPSKVVHVDASGSDNHDDGPTFSGTDHFQKLPGTTLFFGGTGSLGGISVGTGVNVGHQNTFFISQGPLTGAGNVTSTGVQGGFGNIANLDGLTAFPTGAIGGYVVFDASGNPTFFALDGSQIFQGLPTLPPDVVSDVTDGTIAGSIGDQVVDNTDPLTSGTEEKDKKDSDTEEVDVTGTTGKEKDDMVTSKSNTGKMSNCAK